MIITLLRITVLIITQTNFLPINSNHHSINIKNLEDKIFNNNYHFKVLIIINKESFNNKSEYKHNLIIIIIIKFKINFLINCKLNK